MGCLVFYAQIHKNSSVLMAAPKLVKDLLMAHPAIIGPSCHIRFIQGPFHRIRQPGIGLYTHDDHGAVSILCEVHRLPILHLFFYF